MVTKQKILLQLEKRRGQHVSGAMLAQLCGVSRNAVWKAVCALRQEGFCIDAEAGVGYCLTGESAHLTQGAIAARMNCNWPITVIEKTMSTNTWLKEREKQLPHGSVVIARSQEGGKGRMGRAFYSPCGGIYCSVLLRPTKEQAPFVPMLTVAAAVAAAEASETVSGQSVGIKWVNDLYRNGRKICGILCEGSYQMELGAPNYVIIGVGMNLWTPKEGWPTEIKEVAGCLLEDTSMSVEVMAQWCATYLDRLAAYAEQLTTLSFIDGYRKRSILNGQTVQVTDGGRVTKGVVEQIDEMARLVLRLEDGQVKAFSAGEAVTLHKGKNNEENNY